MELLFYCLNNFNREGTELSASGISAKKPFATSRLCGETCYLPSQKK